VIKIINIEEVTDELIEKELKEHPEVSVSKESSSKPEPKSLEFSPIVNPKDLPNNSLIYLTRNQLIKNNKDIESKARREEQNNLLNELYDKTMNVLTGFSCDNNNKGNELINLCMNAIKYGWSKALFIERWNKAFLELKELSQE
jgi:hypothetical protein